MRLDTARVRHRVLDTRNLRIGIRMISASSEQVRIISANSGGGVMLVLYPNRATDAKPLKVSPRSYFPTDPAYLRTALAESVQYLPFLVPPSSPSSLPSMLLV